jgi:hypothetical protein
MPACVLLFLTLIHSSCLVSEITETPGGHLKSSPDLDMVVLRVLKVFFPAKLYSPYLYAVSCSFAANPRRESDPPKIMSPPQEHDHAAQQDPRTLSPASRTRRDKSANRALLAPLQPGSRPRAKTSNNLHNRHQTFFPQQRSHHNPIPQPRSQKRKIDQSRGRKHLPYGHSLPHPKTKPKVQLVRCQHPNLPLLPLPAHGCNWGED